MTFIQITSPSDQQRLVELEVENLEILGDVTSVFENLGNVREMIGCLVETRVGGVAWNGVVRPEGELSIADYRNGGWFCQTEIDTVLAYADRERRLTGDSVATIFDVSPCARYLEGCDEVSLVHEKLLRRDGRSVESDTSTYSAVITRSPNGPHTVRVTFTYKSVTVESSGPEGATITQYLRPASRKELCWQLLGLVRWRLSSTEHCD
jgi:hypothetical protein